VKLCGLKPQFCLTLPLPAHTRAPPSQRDLEVFLDYVCDTSGGGDHAAVAAHQIRAILYASNDAFAQP